MIVKNFQKNRRILLHQPNNINDDEEDNCNDEATNVQQSNLALRIFLSMFLSLQTIISTGQHLLSCENFPRSLTLLINHLNNLPFFHKFHQGFCIQ